MYLPTKPRPNSPTLADLGADTFRWYECPWCETRIPVWGAAGAPTCSCLAEPLPRQACKPCEPPGADFRACACGSAFKGESGKRGRPREHCSASCRELAAARATLAKHLGAFEQRATPEAWLALRGEMQGLLAGRPWSRGVRRRGLPERQRYGE